MHPGGPRSCHARWQTSSGPRRLEVETTKMSDFLNTPISCAQARAAVSATVDGEAAELERATARRHLQTCARCREFEAMVLHTRRELRSAPVLEPSRSLRPAQRPARRRLPRPVAVAGVAAALAFAAVVGAGVSA